MATIEIMQGNMALIKHQNQWTKWFMVYERTKPLNIQVVSMNTPVLILQIQNHPNSKVHGANMGPVWGRQDPGGPHVGSMNFAVWAISWETCNVWMGTTLYQNINKQKLFTNCTAVLLCWLLKISLWLRLMWENDLFKTLRVCVQQIHSQWERHLWPCQYKDHVLPVWDRVSTVCLIWYRNSHYFILFPSL